MRLEVGSSGENEEEKPIWGTTGSLTAHFQQRPQPRPLLEHAAFLFSTVRKLSHSSRISLQETFSDAPHSLTSLLPSRVTEFSGLDQNLLVSRCHSRLSFYTELPKSVFCAYFTLLCGKPKVFSPLSFPGPGMTHDPELTFLTLCLSPAGTQ